MIIVVAPDSFKGSLSALEAAQAMQRGIVQACPDAQVRLLPVADGGEGFTEAIVAAAEGEWAETEAMAPTGKAITARFGLIDGGRTAVIETAAASGLTLVPQGERNPLKLTSYGTGQLIRAALDRGCEEIVLGLGGSAINDGGIGLGQALGYRFLDEQGRVLPAGGTDWLRVAGLDAHGADPRLKQIRLTAACDVDAVLCGERGASAVFGPQKGATPEMVEQLDKVLERLAGCFRDTLGMDVGDLPGGGAAGGLGAGVAALCGGVLKNGIELVLDACGFDRIASGADLVLTGEGRTDGQSLMGKTPVGVARRAKALGLPVFSVSGGLGAGYEQARELGIDALFSCVPGPASLEEAIGRAGLWLEEASREIMYVFRTGRGK